MCETKIIFGASHNVAGAGFAQWREVCAEGTDGVAHGEVEQIGCGTVVSGEGMEMAGSENFLQGGHGCAHEREDGLLGIAEEDGMRIRGGEGGDDCPLGGSEVLNFVDLNPIVAREAGGVGEEEAMGFGKEVVEVEDAEGGFVGLEYFFSLTEARRHRGGIGN